MEQKMLGRYIIIDPNICHGKPTFRGTRIMVWQVLEQVASGITWETIEEEWHGKVTKEAISEAIRIASQAFFETPKALHIYSPRLTHPEQAIDFKKEVIDEIQASHRPNRRGGTGGRDR